LVGKATNIGLIEVEEARARNNYIDAVLKFVVCHELVNEL
jgi:hypothetical protein